jgi:hypothetical protein
VVTPPPQFKTLTPLSAAATAAAVEAEAIAQRKRDEQERVGFKSHDNHGDDGETGEDKDDDVDGQTQKTTKNASKKTTAAVNVKKMEDLLNSSAPTYGHYIVSMYASVQLISIYFRPMFLHIIFVQFLWRFFVHSTF